MRLLPKDQDWTAYVWLVYLTWFAASPFIAPATTADRIVALAATPVAVVLYFLSHWVEGTGALWVGGAFVAMGVFIIPSNPAASVFFVYGAAGVGAAFEPARAYRYVAAVAAVILIETAFLHLPVYAWLPALVFTVLVGAVVSQQAHRKRLTSSLLMAQDEAKHMAAVAERERIGRDLHDLLGHTLSLIVLKSELASRLTSTDPERAAAEIRDVEKISREALSEVRSAVRGYRTAGFAGELKQAQRALKTAGIRVETAVDKLQLPAAQETVLALALREAVTNVVRHSQASICQLRLRQSEDCCQLEIYDNGRGGEAEEGSGLSGMRHRVESLGGAFERDGSQGTLLRIRVPL